MTIEVKSDPTYIKQSTHAGYILISIEVTQIFFFQIMSRCILHSLKRKVLGNLNYYDLTLPDCKTIT